MIQNYNTIKSQVDLLEKKCGKDEKIFCQTIYSTAYFVCFKFRKTGENIFLYLGKGKNNAGIWIHDSIPESQIRIQDKFLGILRKDIRNSFLIESSMDEKDRILYLKFKSKGEERIYGFFWKGQSFYFAKIEFNSKKGKSYLFSPGHSGLKEIESLDIDFLKKEFDLIGRKDLKERKEAVEVEDLIKILNREKDSLEIKSQGQVSKKIKSLRRRIDKIKKDQDVNYVIKEIEEILSHPSELLSRDKLKIGRYKIKYHSSENIHHRQNKIFELRKKIKRSLVKIQERLDISNEELEDLESNQIIQTKNIYFNNTPVWKAISYKEAKIEEKIDKENAFKQYQLLSGKKCWVGLSAKGNDAIRKENKNKENLWFHLEGRESAHIIVEVTTISELDDNELQVIASLLKINSQLSSDEIDMMYSPVKGLKPVKGRAGSVTVSRPKYLRMNYLGNWKDFLSIS